ncbi:MAG: glycosyltransferase family 1 protein [Sphingobacteriales bacterium]|nr:MAG: glycosyltransferase family 1 protein [Sphingobacteriales bacterium]
MPRVLRILNRLIIGGPAINATYLTKYLAPEFETQLVIGGKDDHEQDAVHLTEKLGIEPIVVPEMKRNINPVNDGKAYQKVKAIIEKFKPDIVHTHAAKSGVIGRKAAEACKVPAIVHTFHGHVFHSYFSKFQTDSFILIERYLAKRSTGIIAISPSQKDELANIYKICPEDKIKIIPLGLDLDLIQTDQEEKRIRFRQQYFIEDDEIAIGIVGRIVPIKNHTLFVNAAAKVYAQTGKKVRFIIVGDGDMRPQLETDFGLHRIDYAYYPESQRKATAICTSWQSDISLVLAGLDIVVLTSHNEGTPLSLIEAQAAGKPVVSTNVGGVSDVVVNGTTGYVTEPGNEIQLADAITHLVQDEALREQFGKDGRNFVNSRFSYQRLVRDMGEYYNTLLKR